MEKQSKFNTICRNITEQNFCQFGSNCRYLHPGDITTKVFIEKVDKKSKSKGQVTSKNQQDNSNKYSSDNMHQHHKERFHQSPECAKKQYSSVSTDNTTPNSSQNSSTPATTTTYKLNSMNDGDSLNDALRKEKGWRNKIKSQAKKIVFETIPEYAQSVLNPKQKDTDLEKQGQKTQDIQQNQNDENNLNERGKVVCVNEKNNQQNSTQQGGCEAKLRQVNYQKQLERQLEGEFISIENINQDLTLITRDKQVILYEQLVPLIEEDIELTEKFQIHSIIKLAHLDDIIKLFYDPQSCQLYILQLNQSQKKMRFYVIEEVFQYLTHYNKDFNLFFIIIINIDKENIGFFPLPEKKECQYLEPVLVKNYCEQILNFQKTEQTLYINLQKGVIIEEFQLVSQEIFQEMRQQNGEAREFNENSQDMIIVEQFITKQASSKKGKKKMFLSDSESDNENDLEVSRFLHNKSSQNLLKYLSQSITIQQINSDQNSKKNIFNLSSLQIEGDSKNEQKPEETFNRVNSLQSTEASCEILQSPQKSSNQSEKEISQPKTTEIVEKQQQNQKIEQQKNIQTPLKERNNQNQNHFKNKDNKGKRSKTVQPESRKQINEKKLQAQNDDSSKMKKIDQKNKQSQNKNQKCEQLVKKQSKSSDRSKEVSNSLENKKSNGKQNNKLNLKNEKENLGVSTKEQVQKTQVQTEIEEDDLFPSDNRNNNLFLESSEQKSKKENKKAISNSSDENKQKLQKKKSQNSTLQKQQNSELNKAKSKTKDSQNVQEVEKDIIEISISSSHSSSELEIESVNEELDVTKKNKYKKQSSLIDDQYEIEHNLFFDDYMNKKNSLTENKKEKAIQKPKGSNKDLSQVNRKVDSNNCKQLKKQTQQQKYQAQTNYIQQDILKQDKEKFSQTEQQACASIDQIKNSQEKQLKYDSKSNDKNNLDNKQNYGKNQPKKTNKNISNIFQEDDILRDPLKGDRENSLILQIGSNENSDFELIKAKKTQQTNNQNLENNSKINQIKAANKNGLKNSINKLQGDINDGRNTNQQDDFIKIRSDIIVNNKKLQLVKYLKKEDIVENLKKMQILKNEPSQNIISESTQKESVTIDSNYIDGQDIHKNYLVKQQNYSEIKSDIYSDSKAVKQQQQPAISNITELVSDANSEKTKNIKRKKIININKVKREDLNNDYYDNLNQHNTYKYTKKSFEEPQMKQIANNTERFNIIKETSNRKQKKNFITHKNQLVPDSQEIVISEDEAFLEEDIEEIIINEEQTKKGQNTSCNQFDKKSAKIIKNHQFVTQQQSYCLQNQQINYQNQQIQSVQFTQPIQSNQIPNQAQNQFYYLPTQQQNSIFPNNNCEQYYYPQYRGQAMVDFGVYNQYSIYQPLQYNESIQLSDLEIARIEFQKYQHIQQLIN